SGGYDKTVKVWDAATGKVRRTLTGHTEMIGFVGLSPNDRRGASGSVGGRVIVHDVRTGAVGWSAGGKQRLGLSAMAVSADGKWLASGGEAGLVLIRDAATGKLHRTLKGHAGPVFGLAFQRDGRRLISGGSDRVVKVWDLKTGEEKLSLRGHEQTIIRVAVSPDGRRIASCGFDRTVRLWEAPAGRGAGGSGDSGS